MNSCGSLRAMNVINPYLLCLACLVWAAMSSPGAGRASCNESRAQHMKSMFSTERKCSATHHSQFIVCIRFCTLMVVEEGSHCVCGSRDVSFAELYK